MNSYDLHSTPQTHDSPDDANIDPLEPLYILVPLVVLVLASMYYRTKRKREADAVSKYVIVCLKTLDIFHLMRSLIN